MLNEDIGAIADGFAEHFGSNDAETELRRLEGTLKQLSEKEKIQCAIFMQKADWRYHYRLCWGQRRH